MSNSARNVSLTFDDGPNSPYTEQILDILKKEKIKATFFVCGANVKRHPEIVRQAAKEGHLIGNHTYNHHFLPLLIGSVYKETIKTQQMLDELIPQKEKLLRFPWLIAPFWLKNKLKKKGFKIFGGIVGNDWEAKITSQKIADKILSQVKDGSVIILHDGHNSSLNADRTKTVEALKEIIKGLRERNFRFVKLSEIQN